MADFTDVARLLIVVGLAVAGVGALLLLAPKLPFLGRLPGDILIKRDGLVFYAPLASGLLVSALVSLVLWLMSRGR
jgi:hypothetical protein